MHILLFLICRMSEFFNENDVLSIPKIHINVHKGRTQLLCFQRHKCGFASPTKGKKFRFLKIVNKIFISVFVVANYETEIRIIKRNVADLKWIEIGNATNFYTIWYVEIFEVASYESEVRIIKFKMTDSK